MARNPATGLTDKQERFCEEYLKDFNATAAYIRAGYAVQSESSARVNASKLLTNTNVQGHLATLRKAVQHRSTVTLERTVEEISRVAFANITNVLSFDATSVTIKDSDTLPEGVSAAIESVTITETETEHSTNRKHSLKMHNKMSALTLLADFFGIRDDFNKARATLKRYGLAVVQDENSELGWTLEKYVPSTDTDAA